MTSTTLLLLRHGQHDVTKDDGSLTVLGQKQVLAVAGVVGTVDRVVSSPLGRATATAALIKQDFAVVDGLAEFDFGTAPPISEEFVEERTDLALWRASHGVPGGETLGEFHHRVAQTLDDVVMAYPEASVLLVTHAGVIDAAVRWAYGLPSDADWVTEAELPNASITEIERWPLGRREHGAPVFSLIRRLGDVGHLSTEMITDF